MSKLSCRVVSHDVFELAMPSLVVREELFDFIVAALRSRECKAYPKNRSLRKVLENQRNQFLALAENCNSRLRNHFVLRRRLDDAYLNLLQFFLNHCRFLRSQIPERVGKSPRE